MQTAFVLPAFGLPGRLCLQAPALGWRRPPRLPTTRRRASLRCCVESPAWKKGAVDEDFARDEQLQILEEELDKALDAENFSRASEVRDKLLRLQSGAYVAVLSVNFKFYQAFSSGSLIDIAGVWLQDAGATCKHPLSPLCMGYVNIVNSFGAFFSYGTPRIQAKNIVITIRGSCAWVTCDEHCDIVEEVEKKTESGKKIIETRVREMVMTATNIFVKRNGQWYLFHHTAQPINKGEY